MLSTRRSFLGKTAKGLGGVVAAAMAPHLGHAQRWSNCQSGNYTAPFVQLVTTSKAATFTEWNEGDCELLLATLTLNSDGTGLFQAQVGTHSTHSKDVWHFYVELTPTGTKEPVSYAKFSWDGPPMTQLDGPLYHNWVEHFTFPVADFSRIKYAQATSCC